MFNRNIVGISSNLWPRFKAWQFFKDLSRLNVNYIELCFFDLFHFNIYDLKEAELLKKLAEENQIEIISVHAPFDVHNVDISSPQLASSSVDIIVKTLRFAKSVGAVGITLHPGGPVQESRAVRVKQAVESLKIITDEAARLDMEIWIENMLPGLFGNTLDELLYLISQVNSSNIGICLDTGHLHLNGVSLKEAITVSRPYLRAFHLHDNNGKYDEHLFPGEGTIDFSPVIELLQKNSSPYIFFIFELAGSENPLIFMQKVSDFVKQF